MSVPYWLKTAVSSFIIIGLGLVLINCSLFNVSTASTFDKAYKEAEEAGKKAQAAGNEWRDTKKTLDEAKKLAGSGDYAKAVKLANKAKQEYDMAAAQAAANEAYLKVSPFYDPNATPDEDIKKIQGFFRKKFPDLPDSEFANGFYAMDAAMRANWEAIEEFPPYEPAIEEGETLWNTPFTNGKTYSACFKAAGVAANYPRWDKEAGQVETLPMAINKCREANGEKPFKYEDSGMLSVHAYMAYKSRGNLTKVQIPSDDPRALEAYNQGKKIYFSRRGQLNLACYHCHFENSSLKVRANVLGPALGQTSHWPTYRSKWGGMGSLHKRYTGCNNQVRAKAFETQSAEFRNLEYFHTFMSSGIPLNGPGARF